MENIETIKALTRKQLVELLESLDCYFGDEEQPISFLALASVFDIYADEYALGRKTHMLTLVKENANRRELIELFENRKVEEEENVENDAN